MSKDEKYYQPNVLEKSLIDHGLPAERHIKQSFNLVDKTPHTLHTLKSKNGNSLFLIFIDYTAFLANKAVINVVFDKIRKAASSDQTQHIYNCIFIIDEMSVEDFKLILSEFFAEKSMSRRISHKYIFPASIIHCGVVKFELNRFVFTSKLNRLDHLAYKRAPTKFIANLTID